MWKLSTVKEFMFPESHAHSFASIAYSSAYTRFHYLAAYTCALLNNQPMGFYSPATILNDAKRHGLKGHHRRTALWRAKRAGQSVGPLFENIPDEHEMEISTPLLAMTTEEKNPKTERWERTFAILTGDPNELVAPIQDRMTTFVEPRDYNEYLAPAERPPIHLLRILPPDKMRATLVDATPITNQQVSLFDSQ
jgi:hypothetical protein